MAKAWSEAEIDAAADEAGTSRAEIYAEARRQGLDPKSAGMRKAAAFMGCVVGDIFTKPLPELIAACGKKHLGSGED